MTDRVAAPSEVVEAFLDAFAAMNFDLALSFLSDDVEYFEVDDGKVTVWRDYFDLATAAKIHDASAA